MSEEERAALFRAQCAVRAQARAARAATLTGDPVRAAAVRAAWAPLGSLPADGWDCLEPPAPARPSWVGRVPGGVELPEYLKR